MPMNATATQPIDVLSDELMKPDHTPAASKIVMEAAMRAGIPFSLRTLPDDALTPDDIAAACGCDIDYIVQSIVFKGKTTKKPYLVLASSKIRINEKAMATIVGEVMEKADATLVKRVTGFEISSVPPIGHTTRIPVLLDETLMRFSRIWCPAGIKNTMMSVPAQIMARAIAARIVKID